MRVLKGNMGTGICSFSVLGIAIFMSFITGNGIFFFELENFFKDW